MMIRMFTIGSAGFLYADLNEWWMNNRVGCLFDANERADFEVAEGFRFGPAETFTGQLRRAENGLNFAFSAFGSFLYLIGSVLFIPRVNAIVQGTYVFIFGSMVIFLSQAMKVLKQGLRPSHLFYSHGRSFSLRHYAEDLPAVGVDACAGLGGLAYLIGSLYFLPQYDTSDAVTVRAAALFTIGGALFTLSGLFLLYRYSCTVNYPH